MELRDLRIFRDIANEKSFVKAGKLNFLTQPSISVRLKHLEEALGVKLVERVPKKVHLTTEGKLLLPCVEDILSKCEHLTMLVNHAKGIPKGEVHVATIYSIGMYELAPFLKKFIRAYPEIHIHLQYRRSEIVRDLVLKNKVEIGAVAYPETHPKITITPFGTDHLVLIVPPHHPLAARHGVRLRRIHGERFIAFDVGIPTRKAIDEVLGKRGVRVQIRMTNDNIDAIKRAVEVGLGISIVPSRTIREEVRKGTLKSIAFSDAKLNRPLAILTLKDHVLSSPAQLFIQMLTNTRSLPFDHDGIPDSPFNVA